MADHMTTYRWVMDARKRLLDFLATLPPDVFTREHEQFGWGSVRNLLYHVAHTYRWWLDWFFGEAEPPAYDPSQLSDVAAFRLEFKQVDELVELFLTKYAKKIDEPMTHHVCGESELITITPRWAITQTITHEFHHKGIITALARVWGYPPVETDLHLPGQF